jgi:beta-carotene hydroxylase
MAERPDKDKPIAIDRAWLGAATRSWANPTVWLLGFALASMAFGVAGRVLGRLPLPVAMGACTLGCYVAFTVMHEAVHGVAHPNKLVNGLMGRIGAFLLFSPYRSFRGIHLEHHSHTNDEARDPDFGVARKPRALLPLYCFAIVFEYRRHFYARPLWRARAEIIEVVISELVLLGLLGVALCFPASRTHVLTLWVAPALLAATLLAFAFDFLPHYPHDARGRYKDTRAYPGRVLHVLLLAQNYHLVHHLWTTIPWYRYRKAFDTVRPELERRGCRID